MQSFLMLAIVLTFSKYAVCGAKDFFRSLCVSIHVSIQISYILDFVDSFLHGFK